MKNKIVRSLGWILTVITTTSFTYWVAFNLPIDNILAQLGNGWTFLVIALVIAGIVLLIVWPSRWNDTLRWALLAALIVVAFIFGGGPIGELVKSAPWAALGVVAVLAILYVLTVHGGLPKLHKKKIVANKTTPIPVSAGK